MREERGASPDRQSAFRLGPWRVDPSLNRISGGGKRLHLEPKLVELLCRLAETPRVLVSKQELCDAVWPGQAIADSAF